MPVLPDKNSQELHVLSQLTLNPATAEPAVHYVAGLTNEQRDALVSLADSNHVVIRAFQVVAQMAGGNTELAGWANGVLAKEEARIENALTFLHHICEELEQGGCPTTVMKSLDHWPDLGNDLDLYTTADERQVVQIMTSRMGARTPSRAVGATAWPTNGTLPCPACRSPSKSTRSGWVRPASTSRWRGASSPAAFQRRVAGMTFLVPAPEERVIVATLQRMYRHFYFRVCDIVNTAALLEEGSLDFAELKKAADLGGIWPGVATYLKIVCDYVRRYRGKRA